MQASKSKRAYPSSSHADHAQIAALVEDAADRLEPNDDTSGGGGGFTEDEFITVSGAVSVIGAELRDRISHALGRKSLEDLVEPHRTDMSGLRVCCILELMVVCSV